MKATLYFDGRCPLCRREIRWLRRWASDKLLFEDVHCARLSPCQRSAMLQQLHLRTASGQWLVGLPANVAAWRMTPFGLLWAPLLWPGIRQLAHRVYQRWAVRRSQRCEWVPSIE